MKDAVEKLPEYDPAKYAYSWREGSPYGSKGVQAIDVAKRAWVVSDTLGRPATTKDLVDDSFNPESPYFRLVTQDMELAAMKNRRNEVGDIIGAIRYVPLILGTKSARELLGREKIDMTPQKAFYPLRVPSTSAELNDIVDEGDGEGDGEVESGDRGWIHATVVAKTPEYYEQVISELKRQAKQWSIRAAQFAIFSKVVNAISELELTENDMKEYDNTTEAKGDDKEEEE